MGFRFECQSVYLFQRPFHVSESVSQYLSALCFSVCLPFSLSVRVFLTIERKPS